MWLNTLRVLLRTVCATGGLGNVFLRMPAAVLLLAEGQRLWAGADSTLPWIAADAGTGASGAMFVAGIAWLLGAWVRPVAAGLLGWIALPLLAALQQGIALANADATLLWLGVSAALMFGGSGDYAVDRWLART
ncbi:MAG: hypothetical protein ACFCUG_15245, partial [Thiotrichales bacterium]